MKENIYKYFVILSITIICTATECNKDVGPSYYFIEKIDIYPEQRIYHVGDTIWLQHQNAARTIYDSHSNQYFSADTLNIDFSPDCSTVYNLPPDTTNTFCNFILNGVNNGPYFTHIFGCNTGDDFNFKVAMVLNKTGTFSIYLGNTSPVTSCNFRNPYMGIGFPYSSISYQFTYTDGHKDIYLGVTPARRAYDKKDFVYPSLANKTIYFFMVE